MIHCEKQYIPKYTCRADTCEEAMECRFYQHSDFDICANRSFCNICISIEARTALDELEKVVAGSEV